MQAVSSSYLMQTHSLLPALLGATGGAWRVLSMEVTGPPKDTHVAIWGSCWRTSDVQRLSKPPEQTFANEAPLLRAVPLFLEA